MKKDIYTVYSSSYDMTFIMEDTIENNVIVRTEVKGFYWGQPDDEATQECYGETWSERCLPVAKDEPTHCNQCGQLRPNDQMDEEGFCEKCMEEHGDLHHMCLDCASAITDQEHNEVRCDLCEEDDGLSFPSNRIFKCTGCGHHQYGSEFGECANCGRENLVVTTHAELKAWEEEQFWMYHSTCDKCGKTIPYDSEYDKNGGFCNECEAKYQVENVEKNLREFHTHLENTVEDMLDDHADGDFDTQHDVTITVNGKTVTIPLGADVYMNLKNLIETELEDYTPIDSCTDES